MVASEANYIFSDTEKAEKGYVKGAVTDMVTDALVVKPLSTMSIVDLLNKSNIMKWEGLKLLINASLQSKTALTNVFLGNTGQA
ncbi:hypothetical protein CK203_010314 [Vitis vinifera]|uniref:Uncharacterized protein n=1 Tax=Vitis vinifera TaxID=29760 RepID=A0A438JXF4_VITVI|nr:hypothetical protein CK203_010314 [Vitis vinifera]